ncbi:MAG: T9SS type A sorting domain-containing protein [FCB group bacterium]|nr:T9SS type A sorting domain-containing protein [FCB group bacterium]
MKRLITLAITLAPVLFAQTEIFVLCEGNFQTPNATLWSFTDDLTGATGPLYWDPNSNPLGDTGQSLTVNGQELYIVMNNSHTIEKVDLSNGFTPVASLSVPGVGPRYIAVAGTKAFISTWNLSGLLVVDLNTFTVTDTLVIPNAKTEQMLVQGSTIWITSPMHSDWSVNNQVYRIQTDPVPTLVDSFTVVPGPTGILAQDSTLFVTSTYYDANWNAMSGTSTISTATGNVMTHEYGNAMGYDDLVLIDGQVYRGVPGGLAPLQGDLSVDMGNGYFVSGNVYAAAARDAYIYLATSNYTAPDTVTVLNTSATMLAQFPVGALPGSFAFYNPSAVSIGTEPSLPRQFTLGPAYPNPFNPQVRMDITINEPGFLNITVVNVIGETVEQIFSGPMATGKHQISWKPEKAASGTYFIRVQDANTVRQRRMTFLK